MYKKIVFSLIFCFFLVCSINAMVQDMGAEHITLDGGRTGSVPFPHRIHQDSSGNCEQCHEMFPQQQGSIDQLKKEGNLKKKQVMNQLCTKCHRQKKREGVKSGPTSCTGCHVK
jgi:hypothetical protein